MKKTFIALAFLGCALHPSLAATTPVSVDLDYGFMQVNYSCIHRGYNFGHYITYPDKGFEDRYESFHQEDALLGMDCPQQKTTQTYKSPKGRPLYHRGHGVASNFWDDSVEKMAISNRMTNVVPQHGEQNTRGLWRGLEMRVECSRDLIDTEVWVGNIWGADASNDYFVRSHGVTTPDGLWVAIRYGTESQDVFVWAFPNDGEASVKKEMNYRISLDKLQDLLDYPLPQSLVRLRASFEHDPYKKISCSQK